MVNQNKKSFKIKHQAKNVSPKDVERALGSFMKISSTVFKLQRGLDFVTDRQMDKQTDGQTTVARAMSPTPERGYNFVNTLSYLERCHISKFWHEAPCQKKLPSDMCAQWNSNQSEHLCNLTIIYFWCILDRQGCKLSWCGKRRLWSDCADDLSLRWAPLS